MAESSPSQDRVNETLRCHVFLDSSSRPCCNNKEPSRNNLDVYLTVVLLFFGRSEVSTSNLFLDGS